MIESPNGIIRFAINYLESNLEAEVEASLAVSLGFASSIEEYEEGSKYEEIIDAIYRIKKAIDSVEKREPKASMNLLKH